MAWLDDQGSLSWWAFCRDQLIQTAKLWQNRGHEVYSYCVCLVKRWWCGDTIILCNRNWVFLQEEQSSADQIVPQNLGGPCGCTYDIYMKCKVDYRVFFIICDSCLSLFMTKYLIKIDQCKEEKIYLGDHYLGREGVQSITMGRHAIGNMRQLRMPCPLSGSRRRKNSGPELLLLMQPRTSV